MLTVETILTSILVIHSMKIGMRGISYDKNECGVHQIWQNVYTWYSKERDACKDTSLWNYSSGIVAIMSLLSDLIQHVQSVTQVSSSSPIPPPPNVLKHEKCIQNALDLLLFTTNIENERLI